MSHEITIREDGFAEAAFSLKPAWHGLGTTFDHMMTTKEAQDASGLSGWTVMQQDVFRFSNRGNCQKVPGYRINLRSDNDHILGMVSDEYKVVQNLEAFEFLDELVEGHEMLYESAFSLYSGRRVVMLARMPGYREIVKDDPILPYVLLSLSHDGTAAIRFGPTAVRVVCANTYAMAERKGGLKGLSICHTGDIKSKLAEARNILAVADERFAQYAEISQQLAQRQLSLDEWLEFVDIMCPQPHPNDPNYTPRRAEKLANTRLAIFIAYKNERQSTAPETAWAAFNAVAEHIDHLPRRGATQQAKAEARFNVCLYGPGRDMKERAFQTACRFANVG